MLQSEAVDGTAPQRRESRASRAARARLLACAAIHTCSEAAIRAIPQILWVDHWLTKYNDESYADELIERNVLPVLLDMIAQAAGMQQGVAELSRCCRAKPRKVLTA